MIFQHILTSGPEAKTYDLTNEDSHSIFSLVNEKYSTWKWNFGYSPRYQFQREIQLGEKTIKANFHVEKGIIKEISLLDKESSVSLGAIENKLKGQYHNMDDIIDRLLTSDINSFLPGIDKMDLIKGLF
jgi:lipoate-protein ligase A